MKIGAQFFTIRDHCRTTEELDESLKRVADIGYRHIQLSGVCAYDPDWMAERLAAYGLSVEITHFDYGRIIHDPEGTVDFHDKMHCPWIGIGSNPRGVTPEGLATMAAEIKPILPILTASGHIFMYHNHHMEFARFGGETFLDLLCKTFTPEECGITLDTYWVQAGGADPAYWLRRLSGRVPCVHFKDMVYSPEDKGVRMAPIGQGNMNYPAILNACVDAGVEYAFVEQDNCYGEDPFVCLKQSYDWLRAQGLE